MFRLLCTNKIFVGRNSYFRCNRQQQFSTSSIINIEHIDSRTDPNFFEKYKFLTLPINQIRSHVKDQPFQTLPKLFKASGLPKGMGAMAGKNSRGVPNIFISEQRLNILEEVSDNLEQNGLVLSGPHGIGKSVEMYLIASWAYANKYFLNYIPLCGAWGSLQTSDLAAQQFLKNFWHLNSDLVANPPTSTTSFGSSDYLLPPPTGLFENVQRCVSSLTADGATSLQWKLMEYLGSCNKPVLYLFDEHNELFPKTGALDEEIKQAPVKRLPVYFSSFATFTGFMKGFTIYAGSSHSRFEMSLSSGFEEVLRNLKPLDSAEVEQVLTHNSSPFRLPPLDGRSWKDQNQALQYIIFHIGGVFRTLAQFHKSLMDRLASGKRNKATKEDVEHAIGTVELIALDRMRVEWNRLELEKRGRAEESMQELLFSHNPSLSLSWYDAGFVYKDNKLHQLRFVNWVAFQAATKHFLQLIPPPLGGDVRENGDAFERYIFRLLRRSSRMIVNHEYYYEGGAISPDQVRVNEPLHVEDIYAHVFFFKEDGKLRGDFDFQYLLASGKTVLFIPRAKNFDGWDAVLVTSQASSTSASTSASSASDNFTTVVFFQISLEYPESARRWPKFLSAMNSPSPSTTATDTTTTATTTEQVLQMIFPSTRWHTSLDIGSKRFCISSLPSSATEAVTTPKNINFRFVMVTPKGNEARPSKAMRKGRTAAPATISNLEMIGVQHFIPV